MTKRTLFDESVTINKLEKYRSQLDDDDTATGSSGTYAEMVEEVEKVSEILSQTQSKLWETQGELKDSSDRTKFLEKKIQVAERNLNKLQVENGMLLEEEQRLRDNTEAMQKEMEERGVLRTRPALEQRLKKAVGFLKKDLTESQEKHTTSTIEVKRQKAEIEVLKESNKKLEGRIKEMEIQGKGSACELEWGNKNDKLKIAQKWLQEAKEETTRLVEEVASLRNGIQRSKRVAESKESTLREQVTKKVKEKIKLEVREVVTEQVTKKVTREVTATLKAEKEREFAALREQFKKIFKQNAGLKDTLETSEAAVKRATTLQEENMSMKYEVSRYTMLLDETKKEQEIAVAQLESYFRKKIQQIKEDAAKEKWAHATEIRKQVSLEREREVDDFTGRIEALSQQTDRLLQKAEKEKEAYAIQVKRRVTEEKRREIESLKKKLEVCTKESKQLITEASKDKENYASQIRQQLDEQRRCELNKYIYRIETLTTEKEYLEKRIVSLEGQLSWTWQENESNSELLKVSLSDQKVSEDETLKLRRKNQNLMTLVERYKGDFDETSEELKRSRQRFREALLKLDEQNLKLKEQLNKIGGSHEKNKDGHSDTLNELKMVRKALADTVERHETEIDRLKIQNENLQMSMENLKKGATSSLKGFEMGNLQLKKTSSALEMEEENSRLKDNVSELTQLLDTYKNDQAKLSDDIALSKRDFESYIKSSQQEIECLNDQLRDTRSILEKAKVPEQSRLLTGDNFTVASEDDTAQLKKEIRNLERLLGRYKMDDSEFLNRQTENLPTDVLSSEDESMKLVLSNLSSSMLVKQTESTIYNGDVSKLYEKISSLSSLLFRLNSKYSEAIEKLSQAMHASTLLNEKNQYLNYVLDKCRTELAQTSKELETSRTDFAAEDKDASRLKRRIESLNQVLTTERDHVENSRKSECSKQRFNETVITSEKETSTLRAEIESMSLALSNFKNEHKGAMEQAENVRRQLEVDFKSSTGGVLMLAGKTRELESQLEKCTTEHSEVLKKFAQSKALYDAEIEQAQNVRHELEADLKSSASVVFELKKSINALESQVAKSENEHVESNRLHTKQRQADHKASSFKVLELTDKVKDLKSQLEHRENELLHSKRQFSEELIKSQRTIFNLNQNIKVLTALLEQDAQSGEGKNDSEKKLEKSLSEMEVITKQKLDEIESLLRQSKSDNFKLSKKFQGAERVSEAKISELESTIHGLRSRLESPKKEEIGNSKHLCKESIVASRDGTKLLYKAKHQYTGGEGGISSRLDSSSIASKLLAFSLRTYQVDKGTETLMCSAQSKVKSSANVREGTSGHSELEASNAHTQKGRYMVFPYKSNKFKHAKVSTSLQNEDGSFLGTDSCWHQTPIGGSPRDGSESSAYEVFGRVGMVLEEKTKRASWKDSEIQPQVEQTEKNISDTTVTTVLSNDNESLDSTDVIIRQSLNKNIKFWNQALDDFSKVLHEGGQGRNFEEKRHEGFEERLLYDKTPPPHTNISKIGRPSKKKNVWWEDMTPEGPLDERDEIMFNDKGSEGQRDRVSHHKNTSCDSNWDKEGRDQSLGSFDCKRRQQVAVYANYKVGTSVETNDDSFVDGGLETEINYSRSVSSHLCDIDRLPSSNAVNLDNFSGATRGDNSIRKSSNSHDGDGDSTIDWALGSERSAYDLSSQASRRGGATKEQSEDVWKYFIGREEVGRDNDAKHQTLEISVKATLDQPSSHDANNSTKDGGRSSCHSSSSYLSSSSADSAYPSSLCSSSLSYSEHSRTVSNHSKAKSQRSRSRSKSRRAISSQMKELDKAADKRLLEETADTIFSEFRFDATGRVDMAGRVTSAPRRRILMIDTQSDAGRSDCEDTTTISLPETKRGYKRRTGFQRALERASRKQWTKRDLLKFVKTKTPSRRRVNKKMAESPGASKSIESRPFDERKERRECPNDVSSNTTETRDTPSNWVSGDENSEVVTAHSDIVSTVATSDVATVHAD